MNEYWERFETVLKGEIPDRVPLMHVWGLHKPHMAKRLGYEPQNDNDRLKYQLCMEMHLGLRSYAESPFGSGKETASDGTQHYIQGGINAGCPLNDKRKMPEIAELIHAYRPVAEASHRAGAAAEGVVTSCIHALSKALGLEGLAIACYEEPDWLDEAMELVEQYNRTAITAMIEAGFDIVLFDGDCAFKQGLMISPDMMRHFWFNRTRETVKLLREAGVWSYYHTDGKTDEVLPMLIEAGFAATHGCEKAANDLGYLKKQFGHKITLIGNADLDELTRFTPEQVYTTTCQMLATGMPQGRYVADINTMVEDFIPLENYQAFVDAVKEDGLY